MHDTFYLFDHINPHYVNATLQIMLLTVAAINILTVFNLIAPLGRYRIRVREKLASFYTAMWSEMLIYGILTAIGSLSAIMTGIIEAQQGTIMTLAIKTILIVAVYFLTLVSIEWVVAGQDKYQRLANGASNKEIKKIMNDLNVMHFYVLCNAFVDTHSSRIHKRTIWPPGSSLITWSYFSETCRVDFVVRFVDNMAYEAELFRWSCNAGTPRILTASKNYRHDGIAPFHELITNIQNDNWSNTQLLI